jgi:hypothetical protein
MPTVAAMVILVDHHKLNLKLHLANMDHHSKTETAMEMATEMVIHADKLQLLHQANTVPHSKMAMVTEMEEAMVIHVDQLRHLQDNNRQLQMEMV